jgi:hypothetical protein
MMGYGDIIYGKIHPLISSHLHILHSYTKTGLRILKPFDSTEVEIKA